MLATAPTTAPTIDTAVQMDDRPLNEAEQILVDNGIKFTQQEGEHEGRKVVQYVIDPESLEALKADPGLLGRVRNSLECCGGSAAGIFVGIFVGCIIMCPFAIAGGTVLGVGNTRASDGDPSNDAQAAEMQLAGKWVLISGGICAGLFAVIYGGVAGIAVCCAS